jgi:hypothetical protein
MICDAKPLVSFGEMNILLFRGFSFAGGRKDTDSAAFDCLLMSARTVRNNRRKSCAKAHSSP